MNSKMSIKWKESCILSNYIEKVMENFPLKKEIRDKNNLKTKNTSHSEWIEKILKLKVTKKYPITIYIAKNDLQKILL